MLTYKKLRGKVEKSERTPKQSILACAVYNTNFSSEREILVRMISSLESSWPTNRRDERRFFYLK